MMCPLVPPFLFLCWFLPSHINMKASLPVSRCGTTSPFFPEVPPTIILFLYQNFESIHVAHLVFPPILLHNGLLSFPPSRQFPSAIVNRPPFSIYIFPPLVFSLFYHYEAWMGEIPFFMVMFLFSGACAASLFLLED